MSYSESEFRNGLRRQKLDGGDIASLMTKFTAVKKEIKEGTTKGTLIGGELSDQALKEEVLWPTMGEPRGTKIFNNLNAPAPDQADAPKRKGLFGALFGR